MEPKRTDEELLTELLTVLNGESVTNVLVAFLSVLAYAGKTMNETERKEYLQALEAFINYIRSYQQGLKEEMEGDANIFGGKASA